MDSHQQQHHQIETGTYRQIGRSPPKTTRLVLGSWTDPQEPETDPPERGAVTSVALSTSRGVDALIGPVRSVRSVMSPSDSDDDSSSSNDDSDADPDDSDDEVIGITFLCDF